ncbi:uracil-DNA glycosylase [Clostridia bacterium]|nr:uracil-DNA glycosylase [Clostridia bacterium]
MNNQELLQELRGQVEKCHLCDLYQTRNKVVFGAGSKDPVILFVGEAPGKNEDEKGIPFVGQAGQLFAKILKAADISSKSIFVTNIIKCRPPRNRTPNPEEVAHCMPYLMGQIALLNPDFVVTLGRAATGALLETKQSMGSLRGKWRKQNGILVLPTYHPAALLRNEDLKAPTWEDFQIIRDEYLKCLKNRLEKGD